MKSNRNQTKSNQIQNESQKPNSRKAKIQEAERKEKEAELFMEKSGLLWKMVDPKLPNNFFAAQRHFFSLENKFAKNPVLAETYKAVIDTYVNLKHARRLSREEIDAGPAGRTWYNPHHPVFNPNKPGKCRVVFDLSIKCHGICLNDVLLKGPDLLTNLIGILLRFRQYAYPVVADVEKMFHQVRVRPSDGPAFRFLWRNPGSKEPPDVYQMDVHLFGAASSPAVCSNALRQAVRDDGDQQLLQQITRNYYVDNWLVSSTSSLNGLILDHCIYPSRDDVATTELPIPNSINSTELTDSGRKTSWKKFRNLIGVKEVIE